MSRLARAGFVLVLAAAVGLAFNYVVRLWVPQLGAPTVPLMLAICGGVRLGSYIARDKQSADVDDAVAWATGFICAGLWCWHQPVGFILPFIGALYAWSTLGMHKRHYPHHWPAADPMERHAAAHAGPPGPLLGIRPAYRNPDGTFR